MLLPCVVKRAPHGAGSSMAIPARSVAAIRAASFHFLASLFVAALAAALVFLVWYPYPYREIAGGRDLFFLVVGVDVVCGPLLTLVLFNPKKSRRELALDLSLVALVQLGALAYGLYTVAMARPVYLVYEVDRFRVVSVADIPEGQLKPELGGFHLLPWDGPKIIGVREPRDVDEKVKSIDLSMQGNEPSTRPDWWADYALSKKQVLLRAKPVAELREKRPNDKVTIEKAVRDIGMTEENLAWVPLTSFKSSDWVVFIDKQSTEIKAFAPVDGF